MVADIAISGLAANDPVPGVYAEVVFAQGEASRGTGTYSAILIGNKLASGAATENTVVYGPDTAVPLASEGDAITLFGEGSELHRMFRRFVKANTVTPLYAIAVPENGSATAATGTITVTGPATTGGTLRVFIGDEFVDTGFATGDSATTIAAAAVISINSRGYWPVTASNSAGVITITSKQKGLRTAFIRYFAKIIPFGGTGVGVTPVASTAVTAGTAADSNATALATIATERYYYYVSAAEDSTQLDACADQIDTQAEAVNGRRQRLVGASVDTLANTITVVNALNRARVELVWLYQSDVPPCELAANCAAVYAYEESPLVPRLNFDSYGDQDADKWFIKAPLSQAIPTRPQIFAALNAGVTAIAARVNGSTYLTKRITTKYKTGSIVDYRIRDAHKVTVCDRYTDDLLVKFASRFSGKQIGDDPKLNQPIPGPKVVIPRLVKACVDRLTDDYFEDDLLQNPDQIKLETQVIRNTSPKTRISCRIPLQPIDILDQIAARVEQVA